MGNCECNSCPFHIQHFGQSSSTLTVSGAVNNVLGQNGQRLRGVSIHFWHDAIRESHLTLRAPDGSEVKLFDQPALIQWWRNNVFEICFVDCQENADPDPGFSANFNPDEFLQNTNYYGVYYPFSPNECLSNLTGSVNGTWTLVFEDFVAGMDGTLFSWSLEFADNNGTNCSDACGLSDCHPSGGEISGGEGLFCTGSPDLFLDMEIDYLGNQADPGLYGYTFSIADENDLILEYSEFPNLTNYPPGEYKICGLSYKIEDYPLIPQPNGQYTVNNLSEDILLALFCAELSQNCNWLTIIDPVEMPELTGPELVCLEEMVTYLLNPAFEPEEISQILITGNVLDQQIELPFIHVTWGFGQNNRICVQVENDCSGPYESCLDIEVYEAPELIINGTDLVCEGQLYDYYIDPPAAQGESWFISITGGDLINHDGDFFQVEWYSNNGQNYIQLTLLDGPCPDPVQGFLEVELFDIQFPENFNLPTTVCEGDLFEAFVPFDPLFYSYHWTAYGAEVISGENANGPAVFYGENPGIADICLEVESVCGYLGPLCQSLEISSNPVVDHIEVECIGTEYILTITLSGGTSPFNVNGNAIAGNTYSTDPIPGGQAYDLFIYDANFCESNLSNIIECDCIANAGLMSGDTLEICASSGSIVFAHHLGGDSLDINDKGLYVLHDRPGNNLGTIIATSNTGSFTYQDELEVGRIYYISYVVGQADGSLINWNDPCLSIAPGQPLRIIAMPAFEIEDYHSFCWSEVSIPLINGLNGNLNILSSGAATSIDFLITSDSIRLETNAPALLILEYFETNEICFRADTFTVEMFELPSIINVTTSCIGEYYTGFFQIEGGLAPYIINGLDTVESEFFLDTLASGMVLEFHIVDTNGCAADVLEITVNCDCTASAGQFQEDEIKLCEGEFIDLRNLNHTGVVEDDDYQVFFVLHKGSAIEIGEIISVSTADLIAWDSSLVTGYTYYLTAVSSTASGENINFGDPCLDQAIGIPVSWEAGPIVSIGGTLQVCQGEELWLNISSNGPFPFDLILSNSAADTIAVQIHQADQVIVLPSAPGEQIWGIVELSSNCLGEFSGNFITQTYEPLELELASPPIVCNNQLFGSVLDLNSLLSEAVDGRWYLDSLQVIDGLADFNGMEAGVYQLVFSTLEVEEPCPGSEWALQIEIEECSCPQISLPDELLFCSDIKKIALPDVNNDLINGNWRIENPLNLQKPPEIDQEFLIISEETAGQFELYFTLIDTFPPECMVEWMILVNIETLFTGGHQIDFPEICINTPVYLDLNQLLQGQSENGLWVYNDSLLANGLINTSELLEGVHHFQYKIGPGEICPVAESQVTVEVFPKPQFSISSSDPLCFQSMNGSIEVIVENEENAISMVLVNDDIVPGNILNGLNGGVYELEVINEFGCFSELIIIELLEPRELVLLLPNLIEVLPGEIFTAEASINIETDEISAVVWSIGMDTISTGEFFITYSIDQPALIRVDLLTTEGCSTYGEIDIQLKSLKVYLPNVFRPGSSIVVNTVFGPLGVDGIKEIEYFSIFNRWGEHVHEVKNIQADASELFWDGNFRNKKAAEGVYGYHLIYLDNRGEIKTLSGDVLLIR